jgi:hypothetical protein
MKSNVYKVNVYKVMSINRGITELLLKIDTRLTLECGMSLFYSVGHQRLKYLTKTVSPTNLNIFLDLQ